MSIYTIYKATNLINGKSYIGFTSKTLDQRKLGHKTSLTYRNNKFYSAIKKYGWEQFSWDILYQSKDLDFCKNIMEPYFIRIFNSLHEGYNMTSGGDGIVNPSQEVRQKIAEANSKRIITEQAKLRNSISSTGRKHSDTTKQKMAIKATGRTPKKYPCINCGLYVSLGPMKRFHGNNCKTIIL